MDGDDGGAGSRRKSHRQRVQLVLQDPDTQAVLARLGDIYGTTVNRAARLTNAAAASQILVDEATADALRHDPESTLRAHEPLELAGIGLSAAWILL